MKKLLIMFIAITPVVLLAGCGMSPEQKATEDLAKG
jgi:predicted small lipoprotein YifL